MLDLRKLVRDEIGRVGVKEASKFFGVSAGTVSNWQSGKTDPSVDAVERVISARNIDETDLPPEHEAVPVAEPEVTWEGKNVIVGMPVYQGIHPDCHYSLFANYARYGMDKVGLIQEKRTLVYEARNIITHKFLKTNAKYLIQFDSDVIPPCGDAGVFNGRWMAGVNPTSAAYNAIARLMSHGEDKLIVGGLYFGRNPTGKAQCYSGFHKPGFPEDVRSRKIKGLYPDNWVATGCLRVHRDVFARMDVEIDKGTWPECKPASRDMWRGYWMPKVVGMGEDVSFCSRARELGIQPYVDLDLICLHAGDTMFGPNNTKG